MRMPPTIAVGPPRSLRRAEQVRGQLAVDLDLLAPFGELRRVLAVERRAHAARHHETADRAEVVEQQLDGAERQARAAAAEARGAQAAVAADAERRRAAAPPQLELVDRHAHDLALAARDHDRRLVERLAQRPQ